MRLSAFVPLAVALTAALYTRTPGDGSYGIVPPEGASRTVSHAGSELTWYLKQMTGATVGLQAVQGGGASGDLGDG